MRATPALLFVVATLVGCRALPAQVASPPAPCARVERTAAAELETEPEPRTEVRSEGGVEPRLLPEAIHPCDPESSEAHGATAAIDAIDQRIERLGGAADPKGITAELEGLLKTECFRIGAGDPSPKLAFDTGLALKTWWADGGAAWMRHYLELESSRTIVVPPSPRRSLLADGNATHVLAPLLCPANDATCGQEARGFRRRAEQRFIREATGAGWKKDEECVKEASEATPERRYGVYRECLESVAPKRIAMPLGSFKAPADGWLVVAHTASGLGQGCDELAAYDLATGTAIQVDPCSRGATRVGRVSVAAIREAAWMLALAPTVDRNVRTSSESFVAGDEIPIERPLHEGRSISLHCGGVVWGTREAFQWSWMRAGRGAAGVLEGRVSGNLRGPSGSNGAEAHALELLQIATDGFVGGCTPGGAPGRIRWDAPGESAGTTGPASFDSFDRARAALLGGVARLRGAAGTCAQKP